MKTHKNRFDDWPLEQRLTEEELDVISYFASKSRDCLSVLLSLITAGPDSARDLKWKLGIPLVSVYRYIDELGEREYIRERGKSLTREGKRISVYRAEPHLLKYSKIIEGLIEGKDRATNENKKIGAKKSYLHALAPSAFKVLERMIDGRDYEASELAKELNISAVTIYTQLGLLENRGYISKIDRATSNKKINKALKIHKRNYFQISLKVMNEVYFYYKALKDLC